MRIFGSTWLRETATDRTLTLLSEPESPERSKFMFADAPPISIADVSEGCDTGAATVDGTEPSEIPDIVRLPRAVPTTPQVQIPVSSTAGSGGGGHTSQRDPSLLNSSHPGKSLGPPSPSDPSRTTPVLSLLRSLNFLSLPIYQFLFNPLFSTLTK